MPTRRTARAACALLFAVLPFLPGCATPPKGPLVADPASPHSVSVAVSLQVKSILLGQFTHPERVYFIRVSGLNGSACQPRDSRFSERFDSVSMDGTAGDHLSGLGGMDGQGGFGAGGDPTCLYDEGGLPVWEPVLYPASHIRGNTAYLINVPPGRYAAALAVYDNGTLTVFLPEAAVFGSEVAAPPGTARYMGHTVVQLKSVDQYDPLQTALRDKIAPTRPSRTSKTVSTMVNLLAGELVIYRDEAAEFVAVERKGRMVDHFLEMLPRHLGPSPWVERFRKGVPDEDAAVTP